MRVNFIELLNITGTPLACIELQSAEQISRLYDGQLMRIGKTKLYDYDGNLNGGDDVQEKYRFVVAKNPGERQILLKVQPYRIYLRDHEMNSKVIEVNPYQSVRWLKSLIEEERKTAVKLVVNEQQLTQNNNSLIKYISENAIVHILQLKPGEKSIPILYTKQPGTQSKIYKIENVPTEQKIDWLADQISRITSIPHDSLYLVYGGKILPKDRQISEYHLQNNGCIYAVDSRKYMKKVSQSQYYNRLNEVRRVKQSNKAILQKVREENQKKVIESPSKQEKSKYVYEKSGEVMQDFGDDGQYFQNEEMNIESEQAQQFERRANQLQQNLGHPKQGIKINTFQRDIQQRNEQGLNSPPNSPIFQFDRMVSKKQSYNSVNSELKEGRILTKQSEVYQDSQGLIHQHNQEKALFKSGKQKIVDTDIAQDEEGNIIKVEHDLINIRKDTQTGNTIKVQTDVIEDNEHSRTIIKKSEVRDPEGNILKVQTDVYKQENGTKGLKKQEKDIIRETQKVTEVNNQVVQDTKGQPVKIQTDIVEKKQDEYGNTHEYSKDIKQQDGVTTVIERNLVRDKEGNLVELKTDVIKITQDDQGNIYKHERNEIDKQNKKVIIERDIVTDKNGEVISRETDMKTVEQDKNKNIHKHQTDIIEGVDGKTIVIEKNIIQDPEGNILKSDTDMFELNKNQGQPLQQAEIYREDPQAVIVLGQKQPLINGGKQVTIDQMGNTHIHEKQLVQKQGKTTFVDCDRVEDQSGNVIRVETDIVQIEGDDQGNMHKHKSQIVESQDRVVMIETDIIMSPDGVTLREEKDTIEIDRGEDGSIIKNQKDIIQQSGKTKIIEKQTIEDAQGNVIRSQTKITEIEDTPDAINVHEKQEIVEAISSEELAQNNIQQVNKEVEVIEDLQGNRFTKQKQVNQDQYGRQTIVYRNAVQNKQGEIVRQKTEMLHIKDEGEKSEIHRHIVDYVDEMNKVVIEESTSREDFDGAIIKAEKETIEIQKQQDGTIRTRQCDVVEEGGKKIVHITNTIQDQTGNIINQNQDVVEVELPTKENENLLQVGNDQDQNENTEQEKVSRQATIDGQGNLHILEREVQNQEGKQKVIQRQFISNPQGELVKTETGILEVEQGKDGLTRLTATDIVQQGNIVTITQNDSIQDCEGNQVRTETGMLTIEDIGSGLKRKQKQNIIEEGGIKVRVQKQTVEDQQGNILSENIKTTEVTDKYDQNNNKIVSQNFSRKETEVVTDDKGNYHYKEREIIDKEEGITTIVETQVVRNVEGQLLKATTDVIQMTQQQDGTIRRHETNIIEKPDKVTVAESDSIENAEGEKLKGEVESIVITKGEKGETIKKQVGIIMEDLQKTIVEKTVVEDAEGRIIKVQTSKKRIYVDENGAEQARDIEKYEANEDQVGGQPSTFEKEVTVDKQGNVCKVERQTIQDGDAQTKIIQTTTLENPKGDLVSLQTNLLEIQKRQSGTEQVHETNIIQDDKKLTVIQNKSITTQEGEIITSKTQITELQADQQGNTKRTETKVVESEGQTIITSKKAIEGLDGSIQSQSVNVTKVIQKQDGKIEVIERSMPLEQDNKEVQQQKQVDSVVNTPIEIEMKSIDKLKVEENKVQKEIIQDLQGNIHTFEKEVREQGDSRTIIKSETIQNHEGKVLQVNTNIVDTKQTEDGKVLRHETEILSGDRLTTTQVFSLENADGSLISQQTQKIEVQQEQGLIKTNKINIVRQDGKTTAFGVETLQDQDGIIIDESTSKLDINESQQAVRDQARKIAKAQVEGEVKGVVTRFEEDSLGNKHIIQREQIEDHGKKITVDHETIENPSGKIIKVQTEIVTEEKLQNGKVQRSETEIIEQDGKVRVVEFSSIKENVEDLQILNDSQNKDMEALGKSNQLYNLLGLSQDAETDQNKRDSSANDLGDSSRKATGGQRKSVEMNLLQDSIKGSDKSLELPLESGKQLKDENKFAYLQQPIENIIPEQYDIIVISKQRNQLPLTIRYDQIIDEVAQKLSKIINQPKDKIRFYKDGNQLPEYEMVSDLQIEPFSQLYYLIEEQEE